MIVAYHFVGATLRDGRPVPADGEWLEHEGSVIMCKSGLHASLTPWQALHHAPGPVLCCVEIEGDLVTGTAKMVGRRRRILRRVDMTVQCRAFARAEASRVLHLWDAPDVVRRYLEAGDESIRAAVGAAAWDAAWATAGDAAGAAAGAAVGAAARDAAWDAAGARFNALAFAALGKEEDR